MRTPDDALRSLRRWVGYLLPEPWDVQYQRDESTERPAAVVQPATAQTSDGSAYVRDISRSFDVFVYPEGFEGDPARSRADAERVGYFIDRAMQQGLKIGSEYYSRTMRLPVFDYDDTPWDQGLPDDADPYDFYPIDQWTVEVRPDPDDDTLFTVVCSLRMRWRVDGDISRFDGPVLQDVRVARA